MSNQQSNGSKLGAIAGFVIMIAFFLPWVRSCNADLSGYDIATNRTGMVQDAWVYWATLLAGAFCVVLFFLVKTPTVSSRIGAAVARLIAGLVGFLPVLNIWYNVNQKGGLMEILYGGWIMALGYLGVFVSFFVDLAGPPDKSEKEQ